MNPRFAIAISLVAMAILAFWASTMCVAVGGGAVGGHGGGESGFLYLF